MRDPESPTTVIGAPARADELTLGRRRRDLGVLVLFSTAVGALAAPRGLKFGEDDQAFGRGRCRAL